MNLICCGSGGRPSFPLIRVCGNELQLPLPACIGYKTVTVQAGSLTSMCPQVQTAKQCSYILIATYLNGNNTCILTYCIEICHFICKITKCSLISVLYWHKTVMLLYQQCFDFCGHSSTFWSTSESICTLYTSNWSRYTGYSRLPFWLDVSAVTLVKRKPRLADFLEPPHWIGWCVFAWLHRWQSSGADAVTMGVIQICIIWTDWA